MIVSEIPPQIPYVYLLKPSCIPGVLAINKHRAWLGIWKDFFADILKSGHLSLEVELCKSSQCCKPGRQGAGIPKSSQTMEQFDSAQSKFRAGCGPSNSLGQTSDY